MYCRVAEGVRIHAANFAWLQPLQDQPWSGHGQPESKGDLILCSSPSQMKSSPLGQGGAAGRTRGTL